MTEEEYTVPYTGMQLVRLEEQIRADERAKTFQEVAQEVGDWAIDNGAMGSKDDGSTFTAVVGLRDLLAFLDNLGLEESK